MAPSACTHAARSARPKARTPIARSISSSADPASESAPPADANCTPPRHCLSVSFETSSRETHGGRSLSAPSAHSSPLSEQSTGSREERSSRTAPSANGCQKGSASRAPPGGRKASAGEGAMLAAPLLLPAEPVGWAATAATSSGGTASRSHRFHAQSCTSSRDDVSEKSAWSAKRSPTSRMGRKQCTWLANATAATSSVGLPSTAPSHGASPVVPPPRRGSTSTTSVVSAGASARSRVGTRSVAAQRRKRHEDVVCTPPSCCTQRSSSTLTCHASAPSGPAAAAVAATTAVVAAASVVGAGVGAAGETASR